MNPLSHLPVLNEVPLLGTPSMKRKDILLKTPDGLDYPPIDGKYPIDITIPEPKDGGIISENCDVLSVTPSDMCVKVYNTTGGKKNKVTWTNPHYLIQDGVTRFKNGTTYYLNFKLAQSYPVGDVPDAELSEKTVVRVNGRIAPGARPCKKTSPARRGFYILFITFAVKNAILK